jgi:alpha-glucosidase
VYDDIDTLTKFGRLTKVFTILKPYIMKTVAKNANEGIPVMRPLFLQYQSDPDTYGIDHQYMFGDDLLVAPVTEPGVVDWELYLPGPDDWIWLWDRLEDPDFTSGQQYISVRAPLGMPPVFYRATSPFKDLFHRIAIEFALHE